MALGAGLLHGKGSCSDGSGEYIGDWMHGERHGRGKLTRSNGETYDGEWRHDEQTGQVPPATPHAPALFISWRLTEFCWFCTGG